MNYIRPYVEEFGKNIRVYLNDEEGGQSFISLRLLQNIDPSLIREDELGSYAKLHFTFNNTDQNNEEAWYTYTFNFNVIDTEGFEFFIGNDILANYDMDRQNLYLEGGAVPIKYTF